MAPRPVADAPAVPFVSVIVPAYNDSARLTRCLAALENQTYPSAHYEVIVVDNGSDVPVADVIGSRPHLHVALEPRPGVSRARVTGIERARGEILAFTDADCLPDPEWIAAGVACFRQAPDCGVVGGRIEMFADEPGRPSVATMLSMATHLKQERFLRGNWAVCANLFTSRRIIDAVGPMNPELMSSGEIEWCRRVHDAGYQLAFAPTAMVRHPARTSIRALCQRALRHEFAWAQLRETAAIGRGLRFWVGQHVLWPLRDMYRDLWRNPQLTVGAKVQTAALSGVLMLIRIVAWFMMRMGIRYDVRARWG